MKWLSYIHVFCFAISLLTAIFVLLRNPNRQINRAAFVFFCTVGFWNFFDIWSHSPQTQQQTAWFFLSIGSVVWLSIPTIINYFALVYTHQSENKISRIYLLTAIGLSAFFISGQSFFNLISDTIKPFYFGWEFVWKQNWFNMLLGVYFLCSYLFLIYIAVKFVRTNSAQSYHQQTKIVLITLIILYSIGLTIDFVLPLWVGYILPPVSNILVIINIIVFGVFSLNTGGFTFSSRNVARQIIDNMSDAMIIVDNNGAIRSINKATLMMLNYDKRELLNKPMNKIFQADLFQNLSKEDLQAISNMHNFEMAVLTNGQKQLDVMLSTAPLNDGKGRFKGLVCLLRDISEQKSTEQQLLDNETKYRTLFEAANDAIFILNDRYFSDCNWKAAQLLGLTREQIINKHFTDFSPTLQENGILSSEYIEEQIEKAFTGESPSFEWMFTTGNAVIETEVNLNVLLINTQLFIQAIVRDITERKKYERSLLLAKQKAEESDRLKTSFLTNISHEIRTPMNAIIGFVSLLGHEGLNELEKREFVNQVNTSSNGLLNLFDDILAITQIQSGLLELNQDRCFINQLIAGIIDTYQNELLRLGKHDVEIFSNNGIESYDFNIISDEKRVVQILDNLLSNAVKFTEHGFIEVGYRLVYSPAEEVVEFYVKDTGIGLPPDKFDVIFESFAKGFNETAKLYGGMGLGLAISKSLVEILGGNIWVESELDHGSTFYFTIPAK